MTDIATIAAAFFDDIETGKGWDGVAHYCTPTATFSAQSEPVAEFTTIEEYADWLRDGLLPPLPDAHYELKSFGVDEKRNNVSASAVFIGTHTADGGPVPPTGKRLEADYVYVMHFDGDKISHLTKIWNSGWSLRELGWA